MTTTTTTTMGVAVRVVVPMEAACARGGTSTMAVPSYSRGSRGADAPSVLLALHHRLPLCGAKPTLSKCYCCCSLRDDVDDGDLSRRCDDDSRSYLYAACSRHVSARAPFALRRGREHVGQQTPPQTTTAPSFRYFVFSTKSRLLRMLLLLLLRQLRWMWSWRQFSSQLLLPPFELFQELRQRSFVGWRAVSPFQPHVFSLLHSQPIEPPSGSFFFFFFLLLREVSEARGVVAARGCGRSAPAHGRRLVLSAAGPPRRWRGRPAAPAAARSADSHPPPCTPSRTR